MWVRSLLSYESTLHRTCLRLYKYQCFITVFFNFWIYLPLGMTQVFNLLSRSISTVKRVWLDIQTTLGILLGLYQKPSVSVSKRFYLHLFVSRHPSISWHLFLLLISYPLAVWVGIPNEVSTSLSLVYNDHLPTCVSRYLVLSLGCFSGCTRTN